MIPRSNQILIARIPKLCRYFPDKILGVLSEILFFIRIDYINIKPKIALKYSIWQIMYTFFFCRKSPLKYKIRL